MISAVVEAEDGLSDADLLARFRATRDEAAFAELMSRHGRLVWGVCRRRLARREDAEDAFQATFLILAANARAIRKPERLAGWLHRVACHAAVRVASTPPGETSREVSAAGLDVVAELARREAVVAVDEEIVRLPGRYRNPLVLFHLEGLERREVADRLGLSEPTVKTLLYRGRLLLRSRLARRGLALPALIPFAADSFPTEAALSACRVGASCGAGMSVVGLASSRAGDWGSVALGAFGKATAAVLVGAVGVTLFLASGATRDGARPMARSQPAVDTELSGELGESVGFAVDPFGNSDVLAAVVPAEFEDGPAGDAAPALRGVPLQDALDIVARMHRVVVTVDEAELTKAGVLGPDADDTVASENFAGARLVPTLNALLAPKGLALIVRDHVLHVTTRQKAFQQSEPNLLAAVGKKRSLAVEVPSEG